MAIAELTRNAVDVLPEGGLEKKLALGRPLRVKLGIDVTSPDIHVGRAVPLQRMRAFQDEGHLGVLIVGDYTTRIGDPSGRSAERPVLTDEEIESNAKTYIEQAMVILDPERTEVRRNGEWLSKLSYADVVRLARTITVAQILERDDFAKRYSAGEPISVSELLYPLMQAYDSVAIDAKLELARFIVRRSHGEEAARRAEEHFTRVVREGQAPEDVPEIPLPPDDPVHLPALLVQQLGFASTSEARRLIEQGGLRLNDEVVMALDVPRASLAGALLQAGKRRFARLTAG